MPWHPVRAESACPGALPAPLHPDLPGFECPLDETAPVPATVESVVSPIQ